MDLEDLSLGDKQVRETKYLYNDSKICLILSGCFLCSFGFISFSSDSPLVDGMALMHRFHITDGHVTYSSCFLRSDSMCKMAENNRIVVSEFGTLATPDPCKNLCPVLFTFSDFQVSINWRWQWHVIINSDHSGQSSDCRPIIYND